MGKEVFLVSYKMGWLAVSPVAVQASGFLHYPRQFSYFLSGGLCSARSATLALLRSSATEVPVVVFREPRGFTAVALVFPASQVIVFNCFDMVHAATTNCLHPISANKLNRSCLEKVRADGILTVIPLHPTT